MLKHPRIRFLPFGLALVSFLVAFGLSGCSTTDDSDLMNPLEAQATNSVLPRLNVGDTVAVTLSGIPDPPTPEQEKPIQSDGTISMPVIGRVQAAGKTPGELEEYIKSLYVPAVYTHLFVTVQTSSHRVYFVRGEVKIPNQVEYLGPITVTKAIAAAGDFTDFANRRNVILIRATGKHFVINCNKILTGEAPDPPVFPGDQIVVRRKIL
ncbi:MAG: polysaccharide biosynthesis/export family protein [Verrucomicrobiota bacterium]|jgi:polysaccharide export outer membrane protein